MKTVIVDTSQTILEMHKQQSTAIEFHKAMIEFGRRLTGELEPRKDYSKDIKRKFLIRRNA